MFVPSLSWQNGNFPLIEPCWLSRACLGKSMTAPAICPACLVLQEGEGGGGHPQLNAIGQLEVQSIADGDQLFRILSLEKTKKFTNICSLAETKQEEWTALLQSYKEIHTSASASASALVARLTFDDFARWTKKLGSARTLCLSLDGKTIAMGLSQAAIRQRLKCKQTEARFVRFVFGHEEKRAQGLWAQSLKPVSAALCLDIEPLLKSLLPYVGNAVRMDGFCFPNVYKLIKQCMPKETKSFPNPSKLITTLGLIGTSVSNHMRDGVSGFGVMLEVASNDVQLNHALRSLAQALGFIELSRKFMCTLSTGRQVSILV